MVELIGYYKQYYSIYLNNLPTEDSNNGFISKIIFRVICSNCKSLTPLFEQRERWIGSKFIFYPEYNKTKYCQQCDFQNLYDYDEIIPNE